jgi:hypothetical protein
VARKAYSGSPVDSAVAKGIGVNFGSREIADVIVIMLPGGGEGYLGAPNIAPDYAVLVSP